LLRLRDRSFFSDLPSFKNEEKDFSQKSKFRENKGYSLLINHQEMQKILKRDLWSYQIKSMLDNFIENIDEYRNALKFKVSGKILDNSTYILKKKTNRIINNSIETQESIREAHLTETEDKLLDEGENNGVSENIENNFEDYDDDEELYTAFEELCDENFLDEEQQKAFQKEKLNRILSMDAKELNKKLKNKINLMNTPSKIIYKRIEIKDLTNALIEVLKTKDTLKKEKKLNEKEKVVKKKPSFLPKRFLLNAEKKRVDFEKRINDFYNKLNDLYNNEPISFLKMVSCPTPEALVNALLCVLHLINHKKIAIWKSYIEDNKEIKERSSINSGQNIFISPL